MARSRPAAAASSVVKDRQVEMAQALGVQQDVYLHDLRADDGDKAPTERWTIGSNDAVASLIRACRSRAATRECRRSGRSQALGTLSRSIGLHESWSKACIAGCAGVVSRDANGAAGRPWQMYLEIFGRRAD